MSICCKNESKPTKACGNQAFRILQSLVYWVWIIIIEKYTLCFVICCRKFQFILGLSNGNVHFVRKLWQKKGAWKNTSCSIREKNHTRASFVIWNVTELTIWKLISATNIAILSCFDHLNKILLLAHLESYLFNFRSHQSKLIQDNGLAQFAIK